MAHTTDHLPFSLIQNQHDLNQVCEQFSDARIVYVDTEFHRETTYYPQFALIQVACRDACALIDPLALSDLSPLWAVIHNPDILKVFHAARQDVEIILQQSGHMPLPMFDTQIAAALLGFGAQIGFGNLVQRITGKALPKSESFSNWMARPLNDKQMHYAADDVRYLIPVFQHLQEQLEARQRQVWMEEEQTVICDIATYNIPSLEMFWRVKGANKLKPRQLAVLRTLTAWREQQAQTRDIPRRRMLADEQLIAIARSRHLDMQTLEQMRGISTGMVKRFGEDILQAWHTGQQSDEQDWPHIKVHERNREGTELRLELLSTLVRLRADEVDIAANILAGKKVLAELASWAYHDATLPEDNACLKGWRKELVGMDILRMLKGELVIRIDPVSQHPVIETA